MEDGAKEFNVPAFRDNRKLVALENGGLHNPSALVFKSSWSDESKISEKKSFQYPHTSSVHRPSKDEDIAFMSVSLFFNNCYYTLVTNFIYIYFKLLIFISDN